LVSLWRFAVFGGSEMRAIDQRGWFSVARDTYRWRYKAY
jgi:hypothetical protein